MTRLKDGFKTIMSFADAPNIEFWQKEVTPPGLDGGGDIDTTGMTNTAWRTKYPKALVSLTESSGVAAYDPAVYDSILDIINVNQLITITFPDNSTVRFWGWLSSFKPGNHKEGEEPTASFTIMPSNMNDSDVETAPVYSA